VTSPTDAKTSYTVSLNTQNK